MGSQQATQGRNVTGPGQAVVDARMGLGLGRTFSIGPSIFTVVGVTSGRTLLGGLPNAYVTLGDARTTAFRGADLLSAVLVTGTPRALPPGLSLRSNQAIEQGSLQQMAAGISSIDNSKVFMAAIAAVIVASLVYVTALERNRDFAVLKALGASSSTLFFGLALQSTIVALIAALVAAVLAQFMTGVFQQPVAIPGSAYLVLPLVAIGIGLLASLIALRRAVAADPAKAFAG
jgi:putative ABC transport system permease protein